MCNLNRVEASFLKDIGIYGDSNATKTIMTEFILGRKGNLSQEEEDILKQVSAYDPFEKFSRQKCRNLFLFMKYKESELSWSDLPLSDLEYDLGPALDATDYGYCCYFSPFHSLSKINRNTSD